MKKLLLALLIFTPYFVGSQINVLWESRYSSAGANIDQAVDMDIDPSGNAYVAGTSFNSGSGFDLVTVAYDANGTQLWASTYNGAGNSIDEASAIVYDNGSVYVVGYAYISGANYDVVVVKYNATTGAQQWAQTINYQGYYDIGKDIDVDASGDVYFIGYGQYNASGTDTDYFFGRLNGSTGAVVWTDFYSQDVGSPTELDEGRIVRVDGNLVYFSGTSGGAGGSNNFDMVTLEYNLTQGGTPNWNWRSRYDYNGQLDIPTAIEIDGSGNVYVGGSAYFNALQDTDYTLIKYNSSGTQQWVQNYNGPASDKDDVKDILIDGTGNIYITGSSIGNGTAEDAYTIKYNTSGAILWSDRYAVPGPEYDEGAELSMGPSGDVYLAGYSYINGNNNDFTLIRYEAATGGRVWVEHYDGSGNNSDRARSLEVDANEDIYVAGISHGGSATLDDYMTIKYCQLTTDAGTDTAVCVGAPVQMAASGGSNITWSVVSGDPISVGSNFSCNPCANPIATPSVTTVYAVSSTSGNGCVDFDTVTVTINPLPGPVISASGTLSFCDGDSVTLYSSGHSQYNWSTGSTNDSITVYTAGTYTLTVEDSMGCQNATNETVTVFALPTIDAGVSDSVCLGDSTQLLATGGDQYWWDANPELSDTTVADPWATPGVGASWYYVLGEDVNGCQSSDSVMIWGHALPSAPSITHFPNSDFIGAGVTSGIQWYQNGILLTDSTNQQIYYETNGDYWFVYTDSNGCTAISDTISVQDCCNGIEEFGFTAQDIYPNPTNGEININLFSISSQGVGIRVYDMSGKLIRDLGQITISGSVIITEQLNELPSGLYSVIILSDKGFIQKRIVLQ